MKLLQRVKRTDDAEDRGDANHASDAGARDIDADACRTRLIVTHGRQAEPYRAPQEQPGSDERYHR